ncbi:hypothetical protein [Oryza sativa Japonica Group]|uniref:Uncharacterized protein n=1 Tax=Oryza sativa subsp. japonica TaxID=39947 RepID=Q5VN98_ORYSJ|nr:hypothetical protein [Oryza sativa Japonica Group]
MSKPNRKAHLDHLLPLLSFSRSPLLSLTFSPAPPLPRQRRRPPLRRLPHPTPATPLAVAGLNQLLGSSLLCP